MCSEAEQDHLLESPLPNVEQGTEATELTGGRDPRILSLARVWLSVMVGKVQVSVSESLKRGLEQQCPQEPSAMMEIVFVSSEQYSHPWCG